MILTATTNEAAQVKVIDLRREYPGFTGDTSWAVITDLSQEELEQLLDMKFHMHLIVMVQNVMKMVILITGGQKKITRSLMPRLKQW